MRPEGVKKNKNKAKANREQKLELQWTKTQLSNNQKQANKALKMAKELELERLSSGRFHYVDCPIRGKKMVKK